eukprot:gene26860-4464_t
MGLDAFLVYCQVLGTGVSAESALACCFTAAIIVGLLAVTHALSLILYVVPTSIKLATVQADARPVAFSGGRGNMTAANNEVVVSNESTMVGLGDVFTLKPIITLGGLAVISSLHYRKINGSILIVWSPNASFSLPRIKFIKLDFTQVLAMDGSAMNAVTAYALVMIFDIGGAMYGLGKLANLVGDDHQVPGAVSAYVSAAVGSALGAFTVTLMLPCSDPGVLSRSDLGCFPAVTGASSLVVILGAFQYLGAFPGSDLVRSCSDFGAFPGSDLVAFLGSDLVAFRGGDLGAFPGGDLDLGAFPGSDLVACAGSDLGAFPGSELGVSPSSDLGASPGSDFDAFPVGDLGAFPGSDLGAFPGSDLCAFHGSDLNAFLGSDLGAFPGK